MEYNFPNPNVNHLKDKMSVFFASDTLLLQALLHFFFFNVALQDSMKIKI